MKLKSLSKAAMFSILLAIIVLILLTAATFAWFTSNQRVSSSRVEARSGSADVSLLISQQGGAQFSGAAEAAIVQVNSTNVERLMPVSTADLRIFCAETGIGQDGYASTFYRIENEAHYYHGRVYLQAVATGLTGGESMDLYLDAGANAGGVLVQNDAVNRGAKDGLLLNAARLGLVVGDNANGVIFYLSDTQSAAADQVRNTKVNGTVLQDGQVLAMDADGIVRAVTDPAVPLSRYSVNAGTDTIAFPNAPLATIELNRIYPVDIYFYLEGCDPDCSDSVSLDGVDLHLAFYGVLN